MVVMIVGTSKRNGRKGKERKETRGGEPHSGGMGLREGGKEGREWV